MAVTGSYSTTVPASSYLVSGVSFRNIQGHNNLNVVNVDTCDGQVGSPSAPNSARPQLVRNVTVDNVWAYDGDGARYAQQCNEGMRFDGITGLRVVNSRFVNLGACHVNGGTAAVILVAVTNATFANNVIADVPTTSSPDQTGIDSEICNDQISLRNNLFARNAGPAVEYLGLRCNIGDYNTNQTVTGNAFFGNSASLKRLTNCAAGDDPFTGTIDRNISADQAFVSPAAAFAPLLPSGAVNLVTKNGTVPHFAADEFSGTSGSAGWTYQTTTNAASNTAWTAATFTADAHLSGAWSGTGSGSITRFEQTPGTCAGCGSARIWTATTSGHVIIRSLAMKSEAGGADSTLTIQRNGSAIDSALIAGPNISGTELNENLDVAVGDSLRFVVAGNAASDDYTSWTPSISYIDAGAGTGTVANGSFETPAVGISAYQYAPSGGIWQFSPSATSAGAGIASNGSAFGNTATPDGTQVAFIQSQGGATQTVSGFIPNVRYQIGFQIAARGAEAQTVQVVVDGAVLTSASPTSTAFAPVTTPSFTSSSGTVTVTFRGISATDQTAIIDSVVISPLQSVSAANPSFEVPALAAATYQYAVAGATWTTDPPTSVGGSGFASNGSAFGNANAPAGTQVAFVQKQGAVAQTVTGFVAGTSYAIIVSAA